MSALREHRLNTLYETLEAAAERGHVTPQFLSIVERGGPFSPRSIPKLAKSYKISIDDFKRLVGANSVGESSGRENKHNARQSAVRHAG